MLLYGTDSIWLHRQKTANLPDSLDGSMARIGVFVIMQDVIMKPQQLTRLAVVLGIVLILSSFAGIIYAAPPKPDPPLNGITTAIFPSGFNVSKFADHDPAPGDVLPYTIVITTDASTTLSNVTISDTMPAETTFVPGSVTITPPDGGATTGTPPILVSGMTVISSATVSVTFAVTVNAPLAAGTNILNTAAITSSEYPTPTTAAVAVTVQNVAPVATGALITATEDIPVSDTLIATDGNGDALTFSITTPPSNGTASVVSGTGAYIYTPTQNYNGIDSFYFQATDGTSSSNAALMSVTIAAVNDPPAFDPIGAKIVDEGTLLSFSAHATDPDSAISGMGFNNLPAGASVGSGGADTLTFSWTPAESQGPGTYYPEVWASDGALTTTEVITITVNEVNLAPVLAAIGSKVVDEQTTLTFTAAATDADLPVNNLTFSLGGGAPAGANITPDGNFSWTPGEAQGAGVYTTTVIVSDDGTPVLTDSETITLTVNEVNTAPVLAAIGDKSVDVNTALNFTVSATDADLPANTLTYTLGSGAPAGATLGASTGNFSWTPTVGQAPGVYPITFIVSDDGTPVLTDSETITITVVDVADIKLTKTAPASTTAGSASPVIYSLVIDNLGPSPASTILLTDTLPAGVTFVSATPSGAGNCGIAGQTVTCNWAQILAGDLETAVIQVTVDADTTLDLTNVATATSTVTDRTPGNNSDATLTTVATSADVQLTQSDSADPVFIGDALIYTLDVINAGPSDATGVTISDVFSNSLTITGASAECTPSGQTVPCTLGTLTVGGTKSITVAVTPTTDGTAGSLATVSAPVSDPDPGNNTAPETTVILPHADLAVSKTGAPSPLAAGKTLTYTLVVTNFGPSTAQSVTLTDTIPSTVTLNTVTPSQGSCSGSATIVCDFGTLAANDTVTVTITVTPTQLGTLENIATVAAASPTDRDTANNTATVSVHITLEADIRLGMTAAPNPVIAGETITFTLPVTNFGPSGATNITIADVLPAGLTFSGGSAGCTAVGQTVTCAVGSLTAGNAAAVSIVAQTSPALTATIANTATASAYEYDPASGNNTATATTAVSTRADLQLTQTDNPDPVNATEIVTYTLTLTNAGPSDAQSVMLTDTLPSGFAAQSAAGCIAIGQNITCAIGTLAAGNVAVRQITAQVDGDAAGTFNNSAGASSATTDPDGGNNFTTATTTVSPAVDVAVALAGAPNPVIAGETLTYTLTLTNFSLHPATGTQASVTLPPDANFRSASAGCTESGGIVTCALGTLAANSATARTIVADVATTASATLQATASVSATEFDPTGGNNATTENTALATAADLSLAVAAPAETHISQTFSFTFTVANAGPSATTGTTLSAALPGNFSADSVTPSQGSCPDTSPLLCTLGGIDKGATAQVVVTGRATLTGTLSITGNVGSATADPAPGNESAQADIAVKINRIFLPLVLKPIPVQLSIFNDNTGGDVFFEVIGTGVSCTVPNNSTQFCGTFEPGTYQVRVNSACGSAIVSKTYKRGPVTTRIFCN